VLVARRSFDPRDRRLVAPNCGWRMSAFSPLSGNEQTSGERAKMTASDPSPTSPLRRPSYAYALMHVLAPLASKSSKPSYKVLGCHPTGVVLEEDTCGGGSLLEGSAVPRYGRW
jgi:hypothetical protein